MEKKIIIENGKQPELIGQWTIGEVLAAARFLAQWIEGQQIAVQPATQPSVSEKIRHEQDAMSESRY